MICLNKAVNKAMSRLESFGFESYIVGGSVRDALLNLTPADWDIATNANPVQIIYVFKKEKKNLSGIDFGTVSVTIDDISIDITTYRREDKYIDFRHPREISFSSSLFEDMKRRDFTVNALAFNRKDGIIDYFGGVDDIYSGTIKCVGDPYEKFSEDALRIIRAFRFASTLGFKIDRYTLKAVMEKMHLLNKISADRIQDETTKLIMGKGAYKVLIDYPEIIFSIIPELKQLKTISQYQNNSHFSVWDHVTRVIKNSPNDMHIRWAALLHNIGKRYSGLEGDSVRKVDKNHSRQSEKIAREVLTRLNFKNTSKKKILLMIKNLDRLTKMDIKAIKEYMGDYGESEFFALLSLAVSDNEGQLEDMKNPEEIYKEIKNTARKIIDDKQYYNIEDLSIKGADLSEMGYIGKDIGEVLRKLHEVVLNGTVKNDRDVLMKYLRQTKEGS